MLPGGRPQAQELLRTGGEGAETPKPGGPPAPAVSGVCPRCLMSFRHHLVVKARCAKRWRGANFDQAAAEGNVGAAVAGVLGMGVRTSRDLEAFLRRAVVKSYGEGLDPNPAASFDPSEGEAFEFHVGLREDVPPETLEAIGKAAREAVAGSRSFALAEPQDAK